MTKKQKVSKAIKNYNLLLRKNPELGLLAENLEWLIDDMHEIDSSPDLERKVLKRIMEKKKSENKELEVKLISYWIESICYPDVNEEMLKIVN